MPEDREIEAVQRTTETPPRRRVLLSASLLVLVVALVLGGLYLLTRDDSERFNRIERETVVTFRGDRDATTKRFKVREDWRIDWKHTGDKFAFSIVGGPDFGTVVNQKKPGQGSTTPVGQGTFRLKIKANGPWKIFILEPKRDAS